MPMPTYIFPVHSEISWEGGKDRLKEMGFVCSFLCRRLRCISGPRTDELLVRERASERHCLRISLSSEECILYRPGKFKSAGSDRTGSHFSP